jgi:branched-chain amino acid transport system ATP-binding protein
MSACRASAGLAVDTQVSRTTHALEVVGVSSGYGEVTIIRDINLLIPAGSVTAILGSNGAGKTTLLKTISGLIKPSAGQVILGGVEVTQLSPSRRVAQGMCHIPEGRGIFRSLTVRENLIMQALAGQEEQTIEQAVSAFPVLGQRLRQTAGTLSGGEQQMLAMASAFARSPQLVLVDEASLGLAPLIVDKIFDFLEGITRAGASLVIVDQFAARSLEMAHKAYVLRRGELVFGGSAAELANRDLFEEYLGADSS